MVPSAAVGAHGFGPALGHLAATLDQSLPPGSARRRRTGLAACLGFLALVVLAFTGGWSDGELTLDGQGISLWVRMLLDHWRAGDGIPSWLPEMWAGTPAWDLFPAFHLVILVPIAAVVGSDDAVKFGILAAQIAGAWGAFVLARSLWDRAWPAVAAGALYGLHPIFASHGALTGLEPTVWVFAATPWLVWSLRLALRGRGSRYVAMAGLLVAFAVLQQAEQAYSLNEVTKRLTGWAAVIAVPTFIASVYGMNFRLVPADGETFGFWFALTLMATSSIGLYVYLRKREWI